MPIWLGIDIGSASVKVAVVRSSYRKLGARAPRSGRRRDRRDHRGGRPDGSCSSARGRKARRRRGGRRDRRLARGDSPTAASGNGAEAAGERALLRARSAGPVRPRRRGVRLADPRARHGRRAAPDRGRRGAGRGRPRADRRCQRGYRAGARARRRRGFHAWRPRAVSGRPRRGGGRGHRRPGREGQRSHRIRARRPGLREDPFLRDRGSTRDRSPIGPRHPRELRGPPRAGGRLHRVASTSAEGGRSSQAPKGSYRASSRSPCRSFLRRTSSRPTRAERPRASFHGTPRRWPLPLRSRAAASG